MNNSPVYTVVYNDGTTRTLYTPELAKCYMEQMKHIDRYGNQKYRHVFNIYKIIEHDGNTSKVVFQ